MHVHYRVEVLFPSLKSSIKKHTQIQSRNLVKSTPDQGSKLPFNCTLSMHFAISNFS